MTDFDWSNFGPARQRELFMKSVLGEPEPVPTNYDALKHKAEASLDPGPAGYLSGNAGDESTTTVNREAFQDWSIQPRVLSGIDDRSLGTTLLDQSINAPLMLAPVGVQSIIHPDGARASARAADELGLPFVHSTVSSVSIEEISSITESINPWFQLYAGTLKDLNISLIKRAEEASYKGIIITIDTFLMGWRPRDLDQGYFPFLEGEGLANYTSDPVFCNQLDQPPEESMDDVIQLFLEVFSDPSFRWDDLEALIESTDVPVIVKGIMHPDDAEKAIEHGADGVIVSNHGGRQIDGELPALKALEPVLNRLTDEVPVLFDSGIRSGSDVLKTLAIGAESVLLGRPYLYGLALNGRNGIMSVVKNILAELDITLGLAGYDDVDDLDRGCLVNSGDDSRMEGL